MNATGQVVKLEREEGLGSDERGWVVVTLKLFWLNGELTMKLRPHEALAFHLDRKVDVAINLPKTRKARQRQ